MGTAPCVLCRKLDRKPGIDSDGWLAGWLADTFLYQTVDELSDCIMLTYAFCQAVASSSI